MLEQANGRMKTVDVKNIFKKRIKASEQNRQEFIDILRNLVVVVDDPVEGKMYVLRDRQYS